MAFRFLKSLATVAALITVAGLLGCGNSDGEGSSPPTANITGEPTADNAAKTANDSAALPPTVAGIDMISSEPNRSVAPPRVPPKRNYYPVVLIKTSLGNLKVKLNAKDAPLTVENFLTNYVDRGLYDQTIVHYVQSDAMVVAGGFNVDHSPIESRGEILNEADNGLKNTVGTVAMYRHPQAMNSATSQFFFNLSDNPTLDHSDAENDDQFGYCVFGEVIEGMEVLSQISAVEVHDLEMFPSTPVTPVVIQSVQRAP